MTDCIDKVGTLDLGLKEIMEAFALNSVMLEPTAPVTATEIEMRRQEGKQIRKSMLPFSSRFVVEAASKSCWSVAVYAGWHDGDFMYNGCYLETIGLDGVE